MQRQTAFPVTQVMLVFDVSSPHRIVAELAGVDDLQATTTSSSRRTLAVLVVRGPVREVTG